MAGFHEAAALSRLLAGEREQDFSSPAIEQGMAVRRQQSAKRVISAFARR